MQQTVIQVYAMIIYIYSKCSTCQQAMRFLATRQASWICKEITQTPPTFAELQKMLNLMDGNIKKLFNTSGQLYREMQLKERLPDLSLDAALKLLSQHGMLVKRPFLLSDEFGFTGFNEAEWSKKI